MNEKSIKGRTVRRGTREYVEIEGSNTRFDSIKNKIKNYKYTDISNQNQDIMYDFLCDLERGKYVSKNSPKGPRSPKRLVKLFYCIKRMLHNLPDKSLYEITEKEIEKYFDDLNNDVIRKLNGEPYKDKRDFKKDFSTFWHWHMIKEYKVNDRKISDIMEYVTTAKESRPKFIFFTLDELKEQILPCTNNEDLKAIMLILFDLGARPSEFYNIRMSDISYSKSDNKYMIDIPEETSKTFGRKIKLWITSSIMKKFLERNKFEKNDLVFIRRRGYIKKLFWTMNNMGKIKSLTEKYGKNLTMYDFRHSSACYYLNRYPTAKDMKYRFGWKKESEIEYYTSFLGKQDFLSEEDLMTPEDKTKLEKDLEFEKKERKKLEGVMKTQQDTMMKQIEQLRKMVLKKAMEEIRS